MSVWAWIGVGVGALLISSVVIALGIGAVLARIGDEVTQLLEMERWTSAPLTRSPEAESAPASGRTSVHPRTDHSLR